MWAKPNVCVFALNDEAESREFKQFFANHDVNVTYYAPIKKEDKNYTNEITQQFKSFVGSMIAKKQNCDLMTISGHHSGEFWGENVAGRLSLQDIYKMSCEPEYANFFNEIKGWWLLGCQTDGLNIKSAEEEAQRLLRECDRDENQEYCDYSRNLITYGSLFDKDAPYLSSLQTISPKSYMFAFTKKAPLSPRSLSTFQRQFEKTATVLSQELNNSVQSSLLPSHVTSINTIVNRLLNPNLDRCQNCSEVGDEQFQASIIKGWNQHDADRYKPNALPPLDKQAKSCNYKNDALLNKDVLTKLPTNELISCHHDLDCMMMNQIEGLQCIKNKRTDCKNKYDLNTTKKLLDILTNPNNKQAYSIFAKSFNNVESLIRELRTVKPSDWNSQIKPMLQNNYNSDYSVLKAYFDNKIDPSLSVKNSSGFVETSALRKMALYSVEKAILDGTNAESHSEDHRNTIKSQVRNLLENKDLSNKNFNDYRQELVRALYYYEVNDITQLNKDNLPPGVTQVNGQLNVSDPSQMVGMVEHLSNRNLVNVTERQRQQILYNIISKVPKDEIEKLNKAQKTDYYSAYESFVDDDFIRKRNDVYINQSSATTVWGLRGFLATADSSQADQVLKKLKPKLLNEGDRDILIASLDRMDAPSSEISRVVQDLHSDKLLVGQDAQLLRAIRNSTGNKFETYIYLQEKLKSKKYNKSDMLGQILRLGQRPTVEYNMIVDYLSITKKLDTANNSCALYYYYKKQYQEKFGVNTNTSKITGC